MLDWADPRFPLDLDDILAAVTLYWHTDTIQRCAFHYRELIKPEISMPPMTKTKPLGYSYFPSEMFLLPTDASQNLYPNMVRRYTHDKVGFFAQVSKFTREAYS